MGRRRRSLIGTPKTTPTPSADAEAQPESAGSESESAEAIRGEASPNPDPGSESEASVESETSDPEVKEAEGSQEENPIPDTSWDQTTEDTEYSEADTVMEDDHLPSEFAEEAVIEGDSSDERDAAESSAQEPEEDSVVAGPVDPASVDYSRFGMDTSVVTADDSFEAGSESGPPTEEVPMYQDVGGVRSAPMNVPPPPDVPGLGDRFTPPPANRTDVGDRQSSSRPSYLAEPTPAPVGRTHRPDPFDSSALVGASKKRGEDDDEDSDDENAPIQIRYLVFGAALVLVSALMFIGYISLFPSAGSTVSAASSEGEEVSHIRGVEVRKGIEKESPKFLGNVNEEELDQEAEDGEAEGDAVPEQAAEETPSEAKEVAPAPAPAPAAVAPKPRPAPKPVAAPSQLMIRANRKVLVVIDGKAVGYTPIDQEVAVGAHTVDATVPGQPTTKQSQSVEAAAGSEQTVTFTF